MAALDAVLDDIDKNLEASTQRLVEFLKIPSVSTDPAYTRDCQRGADWLVGQLRGLGYAAEARPTQGHPIVVGHAPGKRKDLPHLLFYGHYDVQPADPLDLWAAAAFEPRIVSSARTAQADRRARRRRRQGPADDLHRGLPRLQPPTAACRCDVTFLFEGEEEIRLDLAAGLPRRQQAGA